jgi:threonine dehydrogenase-like Zn-dependent dehydrogenase
MTGGVVERPRGSLRMNVLNHVGLTGTDLAFKLSGAESVVVTDVIPERLATALAVGADAVINAADDDVVDHLRELHGSATEALGAPKVGTDIYLDAAGAPAVIAAIISDRIPFENVQDALTVAATQGTEGKVVVTFDE